MYTISAETGDYTGHAQSNQRVMMSKSISSPLSAFSSGSVFDVMDKTGCSDLINRISSRLDKTGRHDSIQKLIHPCMHIRLIETHEK